MCSPDQAADDHLDLVQQAEPHRAQDWRFMFHKNNSSMGRTTMRSDRYFSFGASSGKPREALEKIAEEHFGEAGGSAPKMPLVFKINNLHFIVVRM